MPRERNIDKELKPFQLGLTGKLISSTNSSRLILEGDRPVVDNFKTLQNIRYTDNGIRGIRGMSKINTTALSTHPKTRTVHHFKKSQPQESHVLTQSFNSGLTESVVLKNDTAIPNTGDFNGTALHTDDSNATKGRFATGISGRLLYCNGTETMVWGGDESRLSSFIIFDPDGDFKYDYTEKVQNTLTDTSNVASVFTTAGGDDANGLLLLHCDGTDGGTTFTDDGNGAGHTVTPAGDANTATAQKKFGTASCELDGTGDWLTVPDHANFDLFNSGTWTVDMWVYTTSLATVQGLCSQGATGADTEYMSLEIKADGAVRFKLFTTASGNVFTITSQLGDITVNTWHHIAVVSSPGSSNTDYKIYIDGKQKSYINDANKPLSTYDSTVNIGSTITGDTTGQPFTGYIDEIRISDNARWTADFTPPTSAYSSSVTANFYVGNILPISAIHYDVSTANTAAGAASVFYWNGSAWVAVSNLTDGTEDPAGDPLGKSGAMTFDSTESVAKQSIIDGILGFWYKVEITNTDTTTRISQVTVTEPWQKIQDFWDGELRFVASAQLFQSSIFKDNTVNVFEDSFVYEGTAGGDLSSYMNMDGLATGTEYLTLGFLERQQGINIKLVPGHTNTEAGTILTVKYWNGASWTSVGTVTDGTLENNVSLTKSGFITWNAVAENTEFKRDVNKEDPLYYYQLSWDKTLSALGSGLEDAVLVYYIAGIPVQKPISNYSFPLNAQSRSWLFSDQGEMKNSVIVSARDTVNGFNGRDSSVISFGDNTEITAAAELFVKLVTGAVSDILIAKANSMFLLTGTNPDDWTITQISNSVGCVAPYTFKASPIGLEFAPLQSKQVVIWQSESGIMMYDTDSIFPISDNISNYFDQSKSESINLDKIADSYGFWDNSNGSYEYHWLFASGSSTTLDKELVFDLRRQKWWEASRGSANQLQCGTSVVDTNGANYNYGCIDSGFLERLENGTTFTGDGSAITYLFEFGDVPLEGNINVDTVIRFLRLVLAAKTNTSNSITVTHYGDMNQTGKTITMSPTKSGYDTAMPVHSIAGHQWGKSIFHRTKFSLSTNDETIGFEPLWIGGFYEIDRIRLKD